MVDSSNNGDFSGTWHCTHWFPNSMDDHEEKSECDVKAEQTGNQLVLQSLPDQHNAYLLIRLRIEGEFARGSWTENAGGGEFNGKLYSGLMEMIIDKDKQRITGKWIGVGQDHKNNRPDVYTGRWELSRA